MISFENPTDYERNTRMFHAFFSFSMKWNKYKKENNITVKEETPFFNKDNVSVFIEQAIVDPNNRYLICITYFSNRTAFPFKIQVYDKEDTYDNVITFKSQTKTINALGRILKNFGH